MAAPKKNKPEQVKERINNIITETDEHMGILISEWERFYFDGVKKGFKEARKQAMEVKRGVTLIRKLMSEMGKV